MSYITFLAGKRMTAPATGVTVLPDAIHASLFPFQRDMTRWALAKGRAALFEDAGLGKTRQQLEFARLSKKRGLILAPLSVAKQTSREAAIIGLDVPYVRSQDAVCTHQTVITNYEMLEHFNPDAFECVVLDESSILKNTAGAYRNALTEAFAQTPFRICCSATPAPNDIQEITNHSAFLDIMPRRDVLATFFMHMSEDARASGWRLKNHARPAFWRWLASWGMSLKKPSDLGYSDEGYELPALSIKPVIVDAAVRLSGRLFAEKMHGIQDRAAVRQQTLEPRVQATAAIIRQYPDEPFIAWRGLVAEGRRLAELLGDRAILVEGPMSPEEKAERLEDFIAADNAVLVTAPTIAGFGLNFQHCSRMAFVGLSDSYEQYYQAIRRCYRFGQTKPVTAYVVLSEPERDIFENVLRKERQADAMACELVKHVAAFERAELGQMPMAYEYEPAKAMRLPSWMGALNV